MGLFLIKEIKSREGVVHFRRWRIIATPWFSLYIHGIYKADEDRHMHDHPWRYASLVLSGSFSEMSLHADGTERITVLTPGSFVMRQAEQFHMIKELHTPRVITLFFTGRRSREWGYNTEQGWVDHITYRKNKHGKTEQ